MPALRNYNIFISHAWKYSDDYRRIVTLLDNAPAFRWTNLSVPKHDPIVDADELAMQLHNQMRPADVFVILAGMYVSHSDWIQYEINFARRIGRPIVGVRPWGNEATPRAVQLGSDQIVAWSTVSIVDAIRSVAL